MDTSLFFAQVMGPVLFFSGISLIVKRRDFKKSVPDYFSSSIAIAYIGIFTLLIGLFIILNHNIWDGTSRSLISLFAWLLVFKGTFVLIAPQDVIDSIIRKVNSDTAYIVKGVSCIVFGIYFLLIGYGGAV